MGTNCLGPIANRGFPPAWPLGGVTLKRVFYAETIHAGPTLWRSSLLDELGLHHGFTTRPDDVRERGDLRGWVERVGWFADGRAFRVHLVRQVHGHAVSRPAMRLQEADAVVVDDPGAVAAVRTADCVPILLATRDGHAVAAVHAGWRGLDPTAGPGVIAAAVAGLIDTAGLRMDHPRRGLRAAVGPCIAGRRYEVGPEVADRFRPHHPAAIDDTRGDRPRLDCRAVAVDQLVAAGLEPDRIDVFAGCTFDDAEGFYSYRREGPGVGHQAALIAPRPRAAGG